MIDEVAIGLWRSLIIKDPKTGIAIFDELVRRAKKNPWWWIGTFGFGSVIVYGAYKDYQKQQEGES